MIDKTTLDDLTAWITEEVKLPIHADRELQLAALLSATLDALTCIGPKTTKRVLEWTLARYGIHAAVYNVPDRRPPPPPVVEPMPARNAVSLRCPICDKNGFRSAGGRAGHVWKVHNIRMSELAEKQP